MFESEPKSVAIMCSANEVEAKYAEPALELVRQNANSMIIAKDLGNAKQQCLKLPTRL